MGFYQPPQFGSNRPKFTGPNPVGGAPPFNLDNLIAYYKFNESSSPVVDISGNGHDMVITGGTFGATGIIDDAVLFDGTNDFGQAPDSVGWDVTEVTLTSWVYPVDWNVNDYLFSIYSSDPNSAYGLALSAGGDQDLKTYVTIGGVVFGRGFDMTPELGAWHMYSMSYTSGSYKIYWDGDLKVTHTDVTGDIDTGGTGLVHLARIGGFGFYMGARLDEMSIWGRVLTDAEITELYNGGAGLALPI